MPAPALRAQSTVDQTTSLAALCRVWGLLKYFHPDVTGGTADWDAALIEAIPRVKAAETKAGVNEETVAAGPTGGPGTAIARGSVRDQPEADSNFAWLDDRRHLGLLDRCEPSRRFGMRRCRPVGIVPLRAARRRRQPGLQRRSGVAGWPAAQRRTAAARVVPVLEHGSGTTSRIATSWIGVGSTCSIESIPRFVRASDVLAYHLTAAELIAEHQ